MATARTPLLENQERRYLKRAASDGRIPSPRILEHFVATTAEEDSRGGDGRSRVALNKSGSSQSERQLLGHILVVEEDSRGLHQSLTQTKHQEPSISLSHEEVVNLITTLESTADSLRQLAEIHNVSTRRRRHRVPRCLTTNLFAITLAWQLLNLIAMSVLQAFSISTSNKEEKTPFVISLVVLVIFQLTNLVVVIITTVKLTKQVMHQTVTKSFLGQSYLSTTLLYAGLYTLMYKSQSDAFENIKVSDTIFGPWELFVKMLFFSISTATLCGASHISPIEWYCQLITGTQMLMSYVYFASVLFMAVHPPKKQIKCRVDKNANSPRGGNLQAV